MRSKKKLEWYISQQRACGGLSPIRAKIPKTSNFTGTKKRLGISLDILNSYDTAAQQMIDPIEKTLLLRPLLAFAINEYKDNNPKYLPFHLIDYFKSVD